MSALITLIREVSMQTAFRNILLPVLILIAASLAALTISVDAQPSSRSINFHDDFSSGKLDAWQFPFPEDWVIRTEGPLHFLHMLRMREPLVPRRPMQFALLKGVNVGSFAFQARVRREHLSMMMVFDYVDTLHFYYTHLSVDTGAKVAVHNGIFLVDGEPRRRIAGAEAAPVLPDQNWHTVRVQRDVRSGAIKVFVDDESQARFSVVDHTFSCGQVGLGSFDETGDFTDVRLTSQDAGCNPSAGGAGKANTK
jgi:hypothetical protein